MSLLLRGRGRKGRSWNEMPIELEPLAAIGARIRGDVDRLVKITGTVIRGEANIKLRRMAGGNRAILERGDRAAAGGAHLRDTERCVPLVAEQERTLGVTTVGHGPKIGIRRVDHEQRAMLRRRGRKSKPAANN